MSPRSPGLDKVMVVHGRNVAARRAMFSFLRSIGLHPIEWGEAISLTEKGAPYIGDILEIAFQKAKAILVLLTGDDMARVGSRFVLASDQPYERYLTPQARPNVLFEAGMAFGRDPNRTILVSAGEIRPFSDVVGRHIVHISNRPEHRQALADRLRSAGCKVRIANNTDWLSEGDFDTAIHIPDAHAYSHNEVRRDWEFSHRRQHSGRVWIRVIPCDEYRSFKHEFTVTWGRWQYKGVLDFRSNDTTTLLHSKADDGLSVPLHFHVSQPCFAAAGEGYPPETGIVELEHGWKKIE